MPSQNIYGTHGHPKHCKSHRGRPTTRKDGFNTSIFWQWDKKHTMKSTYLLGDGKHTPSPLYFYSSKKQTKLVTEVWNACQGLSSMSKLSTVSLPESSGSRIRGKLQRKRESAVFVFLFMLCPMPLLQSSPGISSYSHKVWIFTPSAHLDSNIQNTSFSRLTYYSKEVERTKENSPIHCPPSHNSQYYHCLILLGTPTANGRFRVPSMQ